MSYYNFGFPPGFDGINEEAVTKNPGVPDDTNADVGIIDEEDPLEVFFNSANIICDTQMEGTQQQTVSALPDNPAVNNVSTETAQRETLMNHSVPQQIRPTTSKSKVGQKIIMPPMLTNHNPKQAILVYVDTGLVSSSTWPPAGPAKVQAETQDQRQPDMAGPQPQVVGVDPRPGSSTGGKKRPKKVFEYQRSPYEDPRLEKKRLSAINSKIHRDKNKQDLLEAQQQRSSLEQELREAKEQILRKDQENFLLKHALTKEKHEVARLKEELAKLQISRESQQLAGRNRRAQSLLQQLQQLVGVPGQTRGGGGI